MKTKLSLLAILLFFPSFPLMAQVEKGKASFYSRRAIGRRTSSGERLNRDSLTCAHNVYPFGTLLKVRNTGNGREVVVRVNDRGPFTAGRIIDLSYAAAWQLGMQRQGVCEVEVEQYKPPFSLKIELSLQDLYGLRQQDGFQMELQPTLTFD